MGAGWSSSELAVWLLMVPITALPHEVFAVDIFGGWGRGGGQC